MNILERILSFVKGGGTPLEITNQGVVSLLDGAAIGEALGLPVIGRTPYELSRNPVTDLLGFGDYQAQGGTFSLCTESLRDFSKYLVDNCGGGHYELSRFFELCNNWYLIKAKDEEQRLRIMLPCAALAGLVYSREIRNAETAIASMPDMMCDTGVVASSMVFYLAMLLGRSYSVDRAVKRARDLSTSFCARIGVIVNEKNVSLAVVDVLFQSLLEGNDYRSIVLNAVNRGVYPDLAGHLAGIFAGLLYGMENIPYLWRNSIIDFGDVDQLSNGLTKILC